VSQGTDHALGLLGHHLIGVWDGTVTVPSIQKWQRQIESLVSAAPRRTVYLSYERSGFQMPDDTVRKLIIETLRSIDGQLAACAVVLPGSGFKNAAVRALVSGLALVARPKTPLKSLHTIDEAHAWVRAHLPKDVEWPNAAVLRAAIADLEARVGT